jgi:hypothetical protein
LAIGRKSVIVAKLFRGYYPASVAEFVLGACSYSNDLSFPEGKQIFLKIIPNND